MTSSQRDPFVVPKSSTAGYRIFRGLPKWCLREWIPQLASSHAWAAAAVVERLVERMDARGVERVCDLDPAEVAQAWAGVNECLPPYPILECSECGDREEFGYVDIICMKCRRSRGQVPELG